MYTCRVCGYDQMTKPHKDDFGCSTFHICPCCGVQFGYYDARSSHEFLRHKWLLNGAKWHSTCTLPPEDWSAEEQLQSAGFSATGGVWYAQTAPRLR